MFQKSIASFHLMFLFLFLACTLLDSCLFPSRFSQNKEKIFRVDTSVKVQNVPYEFYPKPAASRKTWGKTSIETF